MTIKEYKTKLNKIDPENNLDGWKVIHLTRESLLVMRNGFIEFTIYDIYSGAWIELSGNNTLFSNGDLEKTIKILQATNEFIKSYEE